MRFANSLFVVNVKDRTVSQINAQTHEILATYKVGRKPHEVVVNPSKTRALVSNHGDVYGPNGGHSVTVLDLVNHRSIRTIELGSQSKPHGIAFLNDREALVTIGGAGSLVRLNIETGEVIATLPLKGEGAHMVVVDQQKQYAYVSNTSSGSVDKVDLAKWSVVQSVNLGREAQGLALSHDKDNQTLLVTNRKDNRLHVVDANRMQEKYRFKTDKGPVRVAFLAEDKKAIVTNTMSGTAQIFDLSTQSLEKTLATTSEHSYKTGTLFGKWLPVPISVVVVGDSAYITNFFAGNTAKVNLTTGSVEDILTAGKGPDGLDYCAKLAG